MKAQMRALRTAVLSAVVVTGVVGCELTEETVTVDKHNKLVRDYNDLVERYNNQTGRNVDMDRRVMLASRRIESLDLLMASYTASLLKADLHLVEGECSEASEVLRIEVRETLDEINNSANELAQGTMTDALDAMMEDMSSYREEIREAQRVRIQAVRDDIQAGMTGTKLHARYSMTTLQNRIADQCEEEEVVAPVISEIESGSVVTVDESGSREIISSDALRSEYSGTYNVAAYEHFSSIAELSGGFVGFSPTAELFSNTVDVVLESILAAAGDETDVAIVLDTTSSMHDDIDNVKNNMGRLIEELEVRAADIGLRLSLVLYRDAGDEYLVQIPLNFTSNISDVDAAIQSVTVDGGGNIPEAVNDALLQALNSLTWRDGAKRNVVLIGDAPGHERAMSGESTEEVVAQYQAAGLGIIVYPILVSN